jgi:O-antigen/teichoic acid export membrane protein
MLAGFAIPRVLLVHYGSEANGLVSSLGQFISAFNLVEAGLAGASVLALYAPLAARDGAAINGILSATHKLYLRAALAFSALILALAILYPWLEPTSALAPRSVALLVLALGAKSLIEFFAISKHRVFLTASQKLWVVSLASALTQVLNVALIAILARLGVGLVALFTAAIVPVLLRSLLITLYVRRTTPGLDFRAPPRMQALKKRWDVLYLQILGVVQRSAPIVLATLFTDLKAVSVYAVHNLVLLGINGVIGISVSGLSASFGDVIARGEHAVLRRVTREFEVAYYLLIALCFAVTAALITPFVRLYTAGIHDADYAQPLLGFLFALNGLLYNLKTPQGMLVISAGLYRETRVQSTVQALIIVVLGCVLTPRFGLTGLLLASILSNAYRDLDLLFFIPRNLTGLPVRESALRMLQTLATAALIFVPCHLLALTPATPLEWIRDAVLATLFAALVALAVNLLFQRELTLAVLARLKRAVGRRVGGT